MCQGNLSLVLFNIVIEILAIRVHSDMGKQGTKIFGAEHNLAMYADDTVFFLTDPTHSLHILSKILQVYGEMSRYRINEEKSILWDFNVPMKFQIHIILLES